MNFRTPNAKQIIFGLLITSSLGSIFTACSKDDDNDPSSAKSLMKVTVTVNGADSNDQVDIAVNAGNHDASQYGAPVWKVNGTTQGNEDDILLDVTDFTGPTKTYVFETVKPYNFGSLRVSVFNHDGAPISISYKTEMNGNVETNVENTTVTAGQNINKNFTYTAK